MELEIKEDRLYLSHNDLLGIEQNDHDKENTERHIARYTFASKFLTSSSIVLDCACGSGYGSNILAKKAKEVIGVDMHPNTIEFASQTYLKSNISFICSDLFDLDLEENSFDLIVSLETLEHILEQETWLKKINTLLKKDGTAIISSPMLRYRNGKPYITNPYHISELPKKELLNLISKNFGLVEFFAQHQTKFIELTIEDTGFCIAKCRKTD